MPNAPCHTTPQIDRVRIARTTGTNPLHPDNEDLRNLGCTAYAHLVLRTSMVLDTEMRVACEKA
jgi:hypothetical protein